MTKLKTGVTAPKGYAPDRTQLFQEGGLMDGDDLFNDDAPLEGVETPLAGGVSPLEGEGIADLGNQLPAGSTLPADGIVDPDIEEPSLPIGTEGAPAEPAEPGAPAPILPESNAPAAPIDINLTGIEQFLSGYGVQGGMITYEDGTSARFSDLEAEEQSNILSSLVSNSVPTIEEKYNLDDTEIDLVNAVRDSGRTPEEYINDVVDYRVNSLAAQNNMRTEDFAKMTDDAVFVKHYINSNPEATEDQIAEELVKARDLTSFEATAGALRNSMISVQNQAVAKNSSQENALFNQELEAQRMQVVQTVEGINEIAGARVTDEMKEFLLQDIMELNENKDPILMEKIFSSPETMFKASWFANYGEDYISNLNTYYKKEISKARKAGYEQATNGMPGSPTIVGGGARPAGDPVEQGGPGVIFGKELTEEELFDLEEQ